MKKVFLLLTMLLFAFVGTMRADVVEIGDGTGTTYYFPIDNYFNYSCTEQVYLAEEIGIGGTINSISFYYNYGTAYTANNVTMYMKNVSRTGFTSTTDCEPLEAGDVVWTGAIAPTAAGWYTFTLDTPFEYNGTDNLLVAFYDGTSGYPGTSYTWRTTTTSTSMALRYYSDSTNPDPYNLASYTGGKQVYSYRANVQINIIAGGAASLTTEPAVLDLGYRPNGAWMAPYKFDIKNNGGAVTINALDINGSYFTYNAELPATVYSGHPLQVELTTGEAEAGVVNSTLTVLYSGSSKDAEQFAITANAYDPVEGDVWENAINVESLPYSGNAPGQIYKNYDLPITTEAPEAMYKLTFNEDVLLTAGTTATDGVTTLYPEGFDGEGGPTAENYYAYTGPQVNPGPVAMWFYYDYTGSLTNLGYSSAGNLYFGYMIPAEYLQELGLGNCAITTVESVIGNYGGTYCDLFILKGGDTPNVNNIVYYQEFTNFEYNYWFDVVLDEPQFLGDDENIWIMFATDNTRMVCATSPVDPAGKVWYTRDATSTSWYSSATYTPAIYTQFLELPTGREVTVGNNVKMREGVASVASQINEVAAADVMGVSKAQRSINAKAQNNRSDYDIEEMFVPAGTYYLAMASDDVNFPVEISTSEVPAPEQAVVYYPYDGETWVEYPYLAEWSLPDYTTEMQVLLGTQYPPQTAMIDWTDYLVESAFLPELQNNQSYFMQVNVRNGAGTTYGEVIAFTTPIDGVEGFTAESTELYPGDAAVFSWDANRTFKGYNLYMDGEKVNTSLITATEYSVEGLEYNMGGYEFAVTAVYDAGESELSEPITVYMTGNGSVSGHVYDTDVEHPIAGATIVAMGVDEHGNTQTFTLTTDETGLYEGEILAGIYAIGIISEGYANEGVAIVVNYNELTEVDDIITHEFYYPLGMISATEEENDVLVEWAWTPAELVVDFESGDFSQAEFTLPETYPWAVTTTNPHEGTYCMKSTCEGVNSGNSSIEVTAEVPFDGLMGFWVRVSTEANWDKFHFYIDGVEMGAEMSGQLAYQYKEYPVTEGTHVYKFEYLKDSSVNSNDDCVYVDDITMYKEAGPAPSGQNYNFDDGSLMGWTNIDADGDGNVWVSSANPGIYHNSGVSLSGTGHNASEAYAISGSYANQTGAALTPDNYLVSPAKISAQDGAAINFFVCAQDASYAAEHFGVAVSTGSNSNASDFTLLQEWTLTAKRGAADAEDRSGAVRGTRAQGNWYEYNVDLSAYAGQDIWVAIRHFNCTDMFILNLDDITLGDGSEAVAPRNNRTFQSFNLYRRNNIVNEVPELIATGLTDFSYVDNAWATLGYGEYQWGIAATYDGYAPVPDRSRETATFGFEGGSLEGWTSIKVNEDGGEWLNSDDNLGGYDYSELAHTGSGFAMCYSFVDYVGSFDTDAYLVSPQKYSVDASSSIAFWADNANDDYPEDFSVCVSTAENPTAADFVQIWNGGAKGTNAEKAAVRHNGTRYENWRSHEISLAAYAGQEIWIAFHDVNYDMYEIWIDDVTITYAAAPVPPTPPTPTGDGESEILWSNVIEKDMDATITAYVNLSNGQSPAGATVTVVCGDETLTETVGEEGNVMFDVRKGAEYTVTATFNGYTPEEETIFVDEDKEVTFTLDEIIAPVEGLYVSPTGWAKWEGSVPGPQPTPPTPPTPTGDWYYYTDTPATGIGDSGPFWWGVMYPAGTYTGNMVTKVATYGTHNDTYGTNGAFSGNVTIYNDGTTAPATAVGTMDITMPDTDQLVEFEFPTPVTIDPSKNLWVVFYDATSSDYVASAGQYSGSNADWVSEDGSEWFTLAEAGLTGYGWTIKTYVASGKGEVVEIEAPKNAPNTNGALSMVEFGNRAPISYKVMLDGNYVGETTYPFYQFDVEGMEEGSEHIAQVAPLYTSGMGDWMSYTWTYTSCDNFGGMVEYNAEVIPVNDEQQNVVVTWTLPGGVGPTPPPTGNTSFSEDFEGGLNGWTVLTINADGGEWLHSDDNPGGYDYTEHAHGGSGFAMCYSFVDYVGAFNTDSYLITPQKYDIVNGSTLSFFADNANDSYAESFSVCISTANTPASSADFTQVWSGSAKGSSDGAMVRKSNNRYDNWRAHSIDLSAYAGQTVYIAFHDVNYDMYEVWIDDVELTAPAKAGRTVLYEPHFVTDAGAMSNGADASWIKGSQSTYGPGAQNGSGNMVADDFTLETASTINEIEVYGYQTGSTTTSTFTGLYATIYDGAPNAGGQVVWGDMSTNIMTSTSFTNAYRGSDNTPTGTTRPIMALTATGLNIELPAGTYYLVWNMTGSGSSGPWAQPEAYPTIGNSGNGIQYLASSGAWQNLLDSGNNEPYGAAFKLVGEGGGPVPPQPTGDMVGAVLYRNGEFVGIFDANTSTYVDENVAPGEYSYSIRAIYGGDYDVTYYAMSCLETVTVTVHHLSIAENEVVNSIYPNPTSGDLHINAEAMTHVTVFNAMGQMVYDQNVKADSMVLNMGQFESGVYMVRIDTENGSSVKRITVVK